MSEQNCRRRSRRCSRAGKRCRVVITYLGVEKGKGIASQALLSNYYLLAHRVALSVSQHVVLAVVPMPLVQSTSS